MGVYETLVEIANAVNTEGLRCPSVVDIIEELAAKKGLYGLRLLARPIKGDRIARALDGATTNWQESWLYECEEGNFIVDPDFPKKVYSSKEYKKECFLDPDNIELVIVDLEP